jgi:1-pyrroline-5-carboxylate dehydrogenase
MKNPVNEPILEYKKGSKERSALQEELEKLYQNSSEVPLIVGKKKIFRKESSRPQPMVCEPLIFA